MINTISWVYKSQDNISLKQDFKSSVFLTRLSFDRIIGQIWRSKCDYGKCKYYHVMTTPHFTSITRLSFTHSLTHTLLHTLSLTLSLLHTHTRTHPLSLAHSPSHCLASPLCHSLQLFNSLPSKIEAGLVHNNFPVLIVTS